MTANRTNMQMQVSGVCHQDNQGRGTNVQFYTWVFGSSNLTDYTTRQTNQCSFKCIFCE